MDTFIPNIFNFFFYNYIESSHMINYGKKNVRDNNVPRTMVSWILMRIHSVFLLVEW